MKNYLLLILFFTANSVFAQQKAALHHNGTTQIFGGLTPFIDAYNTSVSGDTIYLAGGSFSAPSNQIIDKSLVIIGAGFHPDSTVSTEATKIDGIIQLYDNADGLYLEGIHFTSSVVKNFSKKVDNIIIKRCFINGNLDLDINGTASQSSDNIAIIESVILGTTDMSKVTNGLLSNSIFTGQVFNCASMTIQNNIFLYNSGNTTGYTLKSDNSTIKNNLFCNSVHRVIDGSSNISKNNVFATMPSLGASPTDINNNKAIDLSTVFVNQTGYAFDFAHNYHLLALAASTYLGEDNTQVGIYGGMFPFKEGAVPQNPHISLKNIANQTDNTGNLQIQFQVRAQNN